MCISIRCCFVTARIGFATPLSVAPTMSTGERCKAAIIVVTYDTTAVGLINLFYWCLMFCCVLLCSVLVCSAMLCYVMVWSGLIWSVLVCSGLFWSVMFCYILFCLCSILIWPVLLLLCYVLDYFLFSRSQQRTRWCSPSINRVSKYLRVL